MINTFYYVTMSILIGEITSSFFPVTFNKSLKVETRPEMLSSGGGVIVLREINEQLKITKNQTSSNLIQFSVVTSFKER
ncbi:MAG: hypothetical protein P9X24_19085 [Candidatus Hatepunaea meridiana]|nr:hypothetical protein [Candidatus Hatepunaea meridiana]